ncbi:MAG: tRNA1(Val) (adenine(37)-N6)-methyltransferase [Cytophagaceae bacterium]
MKVCTDSCLFGAYIQTEKTSGKALDIGTGTGLLSLMLAQKSSIAIDAIDPDSSAVRQAKENVLNSPWHNQITIYHTSLQDYKTQSRYDLIFSNPPFYKDHLKSKDHKYNTACHSNLLPPEDLLDFVTEHLVEDGTFYILYPVREFDEFVKLAEKSTLYPSEIMSVRDRQGKPVIRKMGKFQKHKTVVKEKNISIKDGDAYSDDFRNLLKEYYLNF